jgi:hypothetical protein
MVLNNLEFKLEENKIINKEKHSNTYTAYFQSSFSNITARTGKGIYYENKIGEKIQLFNGFTIKQILEDKEHGYWFVTDNKGLFYVPSFRFQRIKYFTNPVYKYSSVDNALFFVTYNNEVGIIDSKRHYFYIV